ncbi:MAG: hypothetical protein KKB25_02795 [Nanoarchaeota archaeon]|nr:hypothetical protein [Nanoarchaeota archaeon]
MSIFAKESFYSKSNEKLFIQKYADFFLREKDYPTVFDAMKFLEFEELKNVLKNLSKKDEVVIEEGKVIMKSYRVRTDKKKKGVIWKGFEEYANANIEPKQHINFLSGKTSMNGGEFLENSFIKGYLSEVLGNPGGSDTKELSCETKTGELSEGAVKIMNLFNSGADGFTDEYISNESGLPLNTTQHHLAFLKEKDIFSYDVERNKKGWKIYYWRFNGFENLKNCYISDAQKRIAELEEVKEKSAKAKYVCEKFNGNHPVLDFGSYELEETGYKCAECGGPLVFKTGEELAKPLEERIRELKESIEKAEQINLKAPRKSGDMK